jgi:hypothetical protein
MHKFLYDLSNFLNKSIKVNFSFMESRSYNESDWTKIEFPEQHMV